MSTPPPRTLAPSIPGEAGAGEELGLTCLLGPTWACAIHSLPTY